MGLRPLSAYKGNSCNGNCNGGGRGCGDGDDEDGGDSLMRVRVLVMVMAAVNVTTEAATMVMADVMAALSDMASVMRQQRRRQQ